MSTQNQDFSAYMGRNVEKSTMSEPVSEPYFEYGRIGNEGEIDPLTGAYTRTFLEHCLPFIASAPRHIDVIKLKIADTYTYHNPETSEISQHTTYDDSVIASWFNPTNVIFRVDAKHVLILSPVKYDFKENAVTYGFYLPKNANLFQHIYNVLDAAIGVDTTSFDSFITKPKEPIYVIEKITK